MSVQGEILTIWRFTDGKAGHDRQSQGLVQALADLARCRVHDIPALSKQEFLGGLLGLDPGQTRSLSDPDLIVGAGHSTHLSLLSSKRSRGGKAVVLMKPSFPLSWFDLCLIPEHDSPPPRDNILVTQGPLNTVVPNPDKIAGQGMILIGGPSRHYHWDPDNLLDQISHIHKADTSCSWIIADSPRTPHDTATKLHGFAADNLVYKPFSTTTPDWFAKTLAASGRIWATADSMSMIYEALTAGAAVGILALPPKNNGRLVEAGNRLVRSGMVTLFESWRNGQELHPPANRLDESRRCARLVLERLSLSSAGTS